MAVNDRLNLVVVPIEVIWKWQHYGNNFIAVFALSRSRRRYFIIYLQSITIQWQADDIEVTFKEISFEQGVTSSFNNEYLPRSGKMDFVKKSKKLKK